MECGTVDLIELNKIRTWGARRRSFPESGGSGKVGIETPNLLSLSVKPNNQRIFQYPSQIQDNTNHSSSYHSPLLIFKLKYQIFLIHLNQWYLISFLREKLHLIIKNFVINLWELFWLKIDIIINFMITDLNIDFITIKINSWTRE